MDVKIARIKRKMKQDELCKIVGISKVTLSKIEKGNYGAVKFSIIVKIAKALDSTVEDLFDLGGDR